MTWDRNTIRVVLLFLNAALLALPDVVTFLSPETYQVIRYVALLANLGAAAIPPIRDATLKRLR